MRASKRRTPFALAWVVLTAPVALAQARTEVLYPASPEIYTRFGLDLAFDGRHLLVDSSRGARMFELGLGGWSEVQQLTSSESQDIAVDGDTALIADGAFARVFERGASGWVESAALTASSTIDALALDDGRALLACPDPDRPGALVHAYQRLGDRWWPDGRLRVANPGTLFKWLTASCALEGERALVGVHSNGDGIAERGRVVLFERRDRRWHVVTELVSSESRRGDAFGASLALDGPRILVGAPGSYRFSPSGAFLFEDRGAGFEERVNFIGLVPPPPIELVEFGSAVALLGEQAFVCSPQDERGKVFAFEPEPTGNWVLTGTHGELDRMELHGFGHALAAHGRTLVVSAPLDSERGRDVGAVHVITLSLPPARRR